MELSGIGEYLRGIELFQDLDGAEHLGLAQMSQVRDLGPEALLFRQDTPRQFIFVIRCGGIELFKQTAPGDKKRIEVFGPGDFPDENVPIDDTAHSSSARTLDAPTVLAFEMLADTREAEVVNGG